MYHGKLVQHMKSNADRVSEGFMEMIRNSDRCKELLLRVPEQEHRRYAVEVYRDLTDWLALETDSIIEERYLALGKRRAQQGVPLSNMFWAMSIARDHLWKLVQQECLIEQPVEFWGGVLLLDLINKFFDRAFYFALVGFERGKFDRDQVAAASAR